MTDIRNEVYNALADIAFKCHLKGIELTEEDFEYACEWFITHFSVPSIKSNVYSSSMTKARLNGQKDTIDIEDEDLDESLNEAWSGVFSPAYIMRNSSIASKSEAQKLSDYIWENELDSGFRNREDFLDVYDFDDLYQKMRKSEGLDESLNESLTSSEVFRYLDDNFPKLKYLDERDYGDDVALFFKLGGDISGLEDRLNDLGVDWKISNGKLRIIVPDDDLDEDCKVTLKSDVDEKEDAGDVEKGIENFNSMTESVSFDEDELLLQVRSKAEEVMTSPDFGFSEDDINDYLFIDTDHHIDEDGDEFFVIEVRAEVSYDGLMELCDALNPIVQKIEKYAYFEPVTSGIIECWIKK